MAEALGYAFGQIRCLFYVLSQPFASTEPLELIPCPARQLAPALYLYDPASHPVRFQFETGTPHYAPLVLGGQTFGYMFVEIPAAQALTEIEHTLLALLATQTALQLNHVSEIVLPAGAEGLNARSKLMIDEARQCLWFDGVPLRVSAQELKLIQCLSRNYGKPCHRDLICRVVYGDEAESGAGRDDRLDMLVFRLRHKLKQAFAHPPAIDTIRGIGYQLNLGPIPFK